jgi:predicted transcriptional regulator
MKREQEKHSRSELIKARCEPELKDRLQSAALAKHLDTSDIIRLACFEYLDRYQLAAFRPPHAS